MLGRLAEQLLARNLAPLVVTGVLEVVFPSGKRNLFGAGTSPTASIRFSDTRAVWAILRDPDLNFGEMFMQGRLVVEKGTIYDVLELLLRHAKNVPVSATVSSSSVPRASARTVTDPPAGVNFTALESRFSVICFSARRSAATVRASGGRTAARSTPLSSA